MPPAADLNEASLNAALDLGGKFGNGTLDDDMTAFCVAVDVVFPNDGNNDGTAAQRTVSNWLPLIRAAIQSLGSGGIAYQGLPLCIDVIFRICQAAKVANTAGRITPVQAAAILAAYNANFV